jgi:hypothetical protein
MPPHQFAPYAQENIHRIRACPCTQYGVSSEEKILSTRVKHGGIITRQLEDCLLGAEVLRRVHTQKLAVVCEIVRTLLRLTPAKAHALQGGDGGSSGVSSVVVLPSRGDDSLTLC